ncbi:MAG TPA: protein kinase, partial [Myxococcales bacterium]|nr:protein kinase [Myxococcales bacterium]
MARCPTCKILYSSDVVFCPRDGTALGDWLLDSRYRIVSKLGTGGMGVVYLAKHVKLGKPVAVKVLKEEISHDPTIIKRFTQEAEAASRIGHENIVNVTDSGSTPEGLLYFVMEYLQGHTLADLLHHERVLTLGRASNILVQICEAMEAAHVHEIIHRD